MLIFVFLSGLIVGSFVNVLILRTWKREETVSKPSYCYNCQQQLKWFDLIPLVSFFALKGKCRSCKIKISWQYPLVELITGLLFIGIVNKFLIFPPEAGQPWADTLIPVILTFIYLVLAVLLLAMFVFDWKHFVIPDKFLYPALFLSLAIVFINFVNVGNHLLSGVAAAGFFTLLVFGSKGQAMGSGDIYLAAIMGLLLGFPDVVTALILAFFAGALVGLWQIIINKKSFKTQIPFGPFLIGSLILVIFLGERITGLYLQLLGL